MPGAEDRPSDLSRVWLAITEHALLPMMTVEGASHVVRYVNPAFCRLINKPKEQLVGKSFGEILPETDECTTLLDKVFRTGKPESHTEEAHSKPHPIFWSYTMWPVMTDERPVGVVIQVTETAQFHEKTLAMNEALILGSVRQHELTEQADRLNAQLLVEITQRKKMADALTACGLQLSNRAAQLEQAVVERTRELTATNKQLEAMVHSIAHDLRAPLRSMQGFSTMLMREHGAGISEAGRDYADRINKSAQFLDAMLMGMLAFSRISQQHIELTDVKLETIVPLTISNLQKEITGSHAHVESFGPWPMVRANALVLTRILSDLVSNALKFCQPDVQPIVKLQTEDRGEFTRVWVEDNGCGIAPDHKDEIFRLFTRLEGDRYAGTGIGLAIVQKGVERMGGRVGVESIVGQGSRFWFELRKAGEI